MTTDAGGGWVDEAGFKASTKSQAPKYKQAPNRKLQLPNSKSQTSV
jgi:hypothetical protein